MSVAVVSLFTQTTASADAGGPSRIEVLRVLGLFGEDALPETNSKRP